LTKEIENRITKSRNSNLLNFKVHANIRKLEIEMHIAYQDLIFKIPKSSKFKPQVMIIENNQLM
jgi:hypothetical protein